MKKIHGGSGKTQGVLSGRGGPKPRIYGNHGGTHHVQGVVHDAPTRPMVNGANYAGHKVGKRKGG
jgi:hypothetical protein